MIKNIEVLKLNLKNKINKYISGLTDNEMDMLIEDLIRVFNLIERLEED